MKYKITVNGEPDKLDHYIYEFNYSSVKDIKLTLSEGKLSIELQMKTKKKADELFTDRNNYSSEALKKGLLFHLLFYSKPLYTDDIRIYIDKKEASGWNPEKSPIIYSLITKDLIPALSEEWQDADAVFEYFLKNHKINQRDLASPLYAFLYSKTKENETERFMYLWMAMNGLYNYLATKKPSDKSLGNERGRIRLLQKVEDWGTGYITQEEGSDLALKINHILKGSNIGNPDIEKLLEEELDTFHPKTEGAEIKLDGYLNLWYPYYLRCNLFHAGQPIALFALAKEIEIRRLEFINKRLDAYLDQNLWKYFDEGYCSEKIDSL